MFRFGLSASISLLVVGGALAQEASETGDGREVVVVTGTKFEQTLMETPDSVSVVTAEALAREPIADLYDVVERIPNVTAVFGEQGFAIRGIDQRGIGGGSGLTITTYVDDAPLGNQTTFFGPTGAWDVEQVEVFRGPQSTNFGRNALAGAIYIRTRDPEFDYDFRARVEMAQADTRQVSAAGGGAIVDGLLAFRLSGDYRESEGFITNTFLDEPADASELSNIRGKLLFTPADGVRIVTTTTYAENFAGEDIISIGASDGFEPLVSYNTAGLEGTETFLNAINATWEISDRWEIQSITTHQSTDYTRIEDFDVTPFADLELDRTGTDEALSQEVRLKYSGGRLQGAVGLYFVDTENTFTDSFVVPATLINSALPPTLLVSRESFVGAEARNFAVFGEGSYDIGDRLSILFGARFDREETEENGRAVTQFIPGIPPGLEPILGPLEGEQSSMTSGEFDAFLPKLGVQYGVSDNTNVAFLVQQGYRAGGSELSITDGSVISYDPEYLTNYELSTRSTLWDGAVLLNTNIFYSDWQDQQVAVPLAPSTPNLTRTENAGRSSLVGAEVALDWAVDPSLDVYGSIGLVEAKFETFCVARVAVDPGAPPADCTTNGAPGDDLSGNEFPFAPNLSANLGFAKEHENGLFYGADVNFRGDMFTTNENTDFGTVSDATVVNARIGYAVSELVRVTVYARNLLDEAYLTQVNRSLPGLSGTARIGDPRVVGIRLDFAY